MTQTLDDACLRNAARELYEALKLCAGLWPPEKVPEVVREALAKAEARPGGFDAWLANLDACATASGFEGSYVAQTGAECWRKAYDDGVTPRHALRRHRRLGPMRRPTWQRTPNDQ